MGPAKFVDVLLGATSYIQQEGPAKNIGNHNGGFLRGYSALNGSEIHLELSEVFFGDP